VSRLHLFVEHRQHVTIGKNSPFSINLKFGSLLNAVVFNNETVAKFTQEIVNVSLHTLIYMNSRRGLV